MSFAATFLKSPAHSRRRSTFPQTVTLRLCCSLINALATLRLATNRLRVCFIVICGHLFRQPNTKKSLPTGGGFCFGWAREKKRTETGMRGAVGSKTGGIKQWDAAQQKGRNRFTGPCRRQSLAITSHPSQPENLAFMRVYGLFYARIGHLQNQPKIAQNSPLMRN